MVKRKPTHQELLQQRREKLFVGRREEQDIFRRNLGSEVPECLVFAIYGQGGIGKSLLVARYREIAKENGALTALTNDAETTALEEQSILWAMARLARGLAEAGGPLKAFEERYRKYRECTQQVAADPDAPPGVFDLVGRTTARPAIVGAKMTPPGLAASGLRTDVGVGEELLVEQAGLWTSYLAKKFNNKDDVALMGQPVETLTPLFVEGVNKLAGEKPVVLCFDTWERSSGHLDGWLRGLFEREGLSAGVWLVIAGRNPPGDEWEPFHPVMAVFELKKFTEQEALDYLRQQEITEEARVAEILAFSGGVPVLVSTLASAKGGSATEAASGLVDRYLKWVDDGRQREAALNCAAARRLDKDVVATVMGGEDGAELFEWLASMPFVQSRPGYWEYHPRVRGLMLSYARSRSTTEARAIHGKLRAYYQGLLAEKGEEIRYYHEVWRRHTLEALYHGLMQESGEAEREGLEMFLSALRGYYPLAGDIVMTWQHAAGEQEVSNEVTRWGGSLLSGWLAIESGKWESALPFCDAIRGREDLSQEAQSEVCFLCGLAYSALGDYERAIEDYRRAIELNPEYASAYYNQACAHALTGNADQACDCLEQAIGLDEESRATARDDKDFDGIREDDRFKALVR